MSKHRYKDIAGNKYGRLTALQFAGKDKHNRALWECACECGNHTQVAGTNLWNGYTKSCGCLFHEMNKGITVDEDGNRLRIYNIWAAMKQRCLNPNHSSYEYYGGRGILVCEEWMDFKPFKEWALANGYDDSLSIDRKDNDGNYKPDNCQWVSMSEQSLNRRSVNNSSGVKGVTWHEATQKWYARIYEGDEAIYSELFDKKEQAIKAVQKERRKILNQI